MNKVAIIGTGQTQTKLKRKDVNLPELMREAVDKALEDADMDISEVDAIVVGNAPELFDGINHPEKWAADSIGGRNLPVIRTHTGGTVGASAGIFAYYTVASGSFETVLTVSGNKLTETSVQKGLSYVYSPIWGREYAGGAVSAVANQARMYMARYPQVTEQHLARVGVQERKNGMNNPYATLKLPNVTETMLMNLDYLCTPLKLLDSCPTSDGACAMVLEAGTKAKKRSVPRSWVQAVATNSDGANNPGRDWCEPKALELASQSLYRSAGITDPFSQIDVVELYDAFSIQMLIWLEGMGFAPYGEAYKLLDSGELSMTGTLPVNPSGGVLSSNSIGASAMIRQAEIAIQLTDKGEDRQVDGAKIGLAHGWGGAIQFHTLMLQSRDEDPVF